ncbi:DUF3105 domain-containing protein [Virgisporangium aurantiacum]|uniref:DUF3105 domain-containing protein n=1 Tax=Virgisporangium aurantiacum TaxID=175570 RepID=A0A8J3Z0Z5_9ACTN|nr:DUF3105 domain-containing protein [Virgisporangium aurantiacum]GIJ53210.1 hypothetical protein Vau01_007260 [Virgisporangium aurantiacum]
MSISTPQSGGSRRSSATKATAGGKPNLEKEESAGSSPSKATKAASKTAGRSASATKAGASSKTAAKAGATKAASRPAAKAATSRPAAKAGGRRPLAPVKVSQGRNWGPIAMFSAVILVAVGIIGFAGWKVYESALTVSDRVGQIDGAHNFRKSNPDLVKAAQHQSGPLKYDQNPPVAGKHNGDWQNCMGDVYDAPIASEHAVHSMEHGAVWLVYNPAKVNKDQIEALAKKIRGKEYSLMSPMENLDTTVSVQAWGFQLKVNDPSDKRIDEFIKATRKNAGVEQASCSGGITETGTTPRDLQSTTGS